MSKTKEYLQEAFAGESQANRRYLAFAQKAEDEGHPVIAKLFRAVAVAETIHAHNHLRIMGGIGDTADNLKEAIGGENYEVTTMYPEFMQAAEAEGETRALRSFKWAYEVEKVHEELFKAALEELGAEAKDIEIYVCPICGYTHIGTPPERCPVCGAPQKRFEKVE